MIDFIILALLANSSDKSLWILVKKGRISPPDGVLGENKLLIQNERAQFPISDSLQLLVYFM